MTDQVVADNQANITTRGYTQYLVPTPDDGKYQLTITGPEYQEFELRLISYDQQANPNYYRYLGWTGPQPVTLNLTYSQTEPTKITSDYNFDHFRQEIATLHREKLISKLVFKKLDRHAQLGKRFSQLKNPKPLEILWSRMYSELNHRPDQVSPEADGIIRDRLQLLHGRDFTQVVPS
jgi:hypothetical protein